MKYLSTTYGVNITHLLRRSSKVRIAALSASPDISFDMAVPRQLFIQFPFLTNTILSNAASPLQLARAPFPLQKITRLTLFTPFASSLATIFGVPSILAGLWESVLRAVPKKKTSHRKKRQRFLAGKALQDVTALNKCSACGNVKRAHLLCPFCVSGLLPSACAVIISTLTDVHRDPRYVGREDSGKGDRKG